MTVLGIAKQEKDLGVTIIAYMNMSERCRFVVSKGNQISPLINRNITYKET